MALDAGCSVLRLPPYHCIFNPIEMVWSQLKHHAWSLNIYSSQPSKVVNVICDVCDQKIIVGKRKNYVAHIMKEWKTFREMNHILDSKIEPLVFHLSDGGDTDDSGNELV